ncbi:MAG: H-NS histone family protein [Rubrivivax sp.]
MAKLADLLAQKAALDKKIAQTQRAERAEAIARVRTLMAQYGLSVADIGKAAPAKRSRQAGGGSAAASGSARKGRSLGKVAPKYRDPTSGAAWSGRGLKPKWLAAALAAGRTLEEFKI